jgi:hypothetical protein
MQILTLTPNNDIQQAANLLVEGFGPCWPDQEAALEEVHSVRWSPDGRRVAFVSGSAIFIVNIHGVESVSPS